MRAKKIFIRTALIVFVILSVYFLNSFLVPALRCSRARQMSAAEYGKSEFDSIVMAAFPSFIPSYFDLYEVIYDEKGFVWLAYVVKEEHRMPRPTEFTLDGDYNVLDLYRYDPLWNQIEQIS